MPTTRAPILCPVCGKSLIREQVRAGVVFKCPHCSATLRMSKYFVVIHTLSGALIAGLIAYFCGARGNRLVVATLLLWIPVFILWYAISTRFFPPWIIPTDIDEM